MKECENRLNAVKRSSTVVYKSIVTKKRLPGVKRSEFMVKGYDRFKNGSGMNARHYSHNDYYEKGHKIPGIAFGNLSAELGVEVGTPLDDKVCRALSENKHAVPVISSGLPSSQAFTLRSCTISNASPPKRWTGIISRPSSCSSKAARPKDSGNWTLPDVFTS